MGDASRPGLHLPEDAPVRREHIEVGRQHRVASSRLGEGIDRPIVTTFHLSTTMSRRAARWLLTFVIAVVGYETIGVRTQATPAPILIVTNGSASNPFDAFFPEILRAE